MIPYESINSGESFFAGPRTAQAKYKSSTTIDNTPVTLHVMKMKKPITPGEILLKEYLEPMGISQNAIARAIGVAPRAINEIVHGKRSITPQMSIRLRTFFTQSDRFWHGLQMECDFRALRTQSNQLRKTIRPARTTSLIESSSA